MDAVLDELEECVSGKDDIDGYYIADRVDDKVWTYGKFSFDPRDRKIIEGLSNLTFAHPHQLYSDVYNVPDAVDGRH